MKIGIDCRLWNETGVGRYIRNLVRELAEIDKRNEYVLFVRKEDVRNIKFQISSIRQAQDKFQIIGTNISWHRLKEQISFAGEIYKHNLDLMHFTYFSAPFNYSKPFIITIHDLIINHFPTGKASTLPFPIYQLKKFAYFYLIKKISHKARKIIAVSSTTKNEIVDHLKVRAEKVEVIYEGVDKAVVKEGTKTKFDYPYLLYVGNSYPHKNLERLALAFEKVQKNNEKLILVGEENYFYKRLKDEFSKREYRNIIFYGHATDEQLASLYKSAQGFVMPSLMEGFGLPPLEAMANGCFVIASDIPSTREVCADAPLYFDPYSIDDIGDKIRFAFSDADKSDFVKRGLERVKKSSWEDMARKTLRVYESSTSLRQGQ